MTNVANNCILLTVIPISQQRKWETKHFYDLLQIIQQATKVAGNNILVPRKQSNCFLYCSDNH